MKTHIYSGLEADDPLGAAPGENPEFNSLTSCRTPVVLLLEINIATELNSLTGNLVLPFPHHPFPHRDSYNYCCCVLRGFAYVACLMAIGAVASREKIKTLFVEVFFFPIWCVYLSAQISIKGHALWFPTRPIPPLTFKCREGWLTCINPTPNAPPRHALRYSTNAGSLRGHA